MRINWGVTVDFGRQFLELGFILARYFSLGEISNDKISIIGPDINQLQNITNHTIGILVDVGGSKLILDIKRWIEIKSSITSIYE
ncbi:MAG: hypothetical protein JW891_08835 [Candidatus Lokiarchaeota archaeon]|nr:hypothetical protein [Candidatus Lokiarchaeota archaeon]